MIKEGFDVMVEEKLFPGERVRRPRPVALSEFGPEIGPERVGRVIAKGPAFDGLLDGGHTEKQRRVVGDAVGLDLPRQERIVDVGQDEVGVEEDGVEPACGEPGPGKDV